MISYFRKTTNREFKMVGLSTDTKPVKDIPNGAIFFEMDTSKTYRFDADSAASVESASA